MDYGKRCKKGKSCGSTCIYIQKECIKEFGPEVGKSLARIRDLLESRVNAGAITEEEANIAMDKITRGNQKDYDMGFRNEESWKEWEVGWTPERAAELDQAFAKLREKFPDEEEFTAKLNSVIDFSVGAFAFEREKITPPLPNEVEALIREKANILEYSKITEKVRDNPNMTLEETKALLQPFADARRTRPVTDEEVDTFVALLPTQERNYLRNAGALGTKQTGGVYGDKPASDAVPVRNGPLDLQTKPESDNRMKLFGRIFMEEDGRDVYTREKIHLTEADMEHIVPESIGGKRSEQGVNYGFFRSSWNQVRSNVPQREWLEAELAKHEFDKRGKLTPESRQAVLDTRKQAFEKMGVKHEFMRMASYAKRSEELEELLKVAQSQTDPVVRDTFNNKLVALTLGVRGTATLGLTSNQRGAQLWNWYGPRFNGGGKAAALMAEKRVELAKAGNTVGVAKMTKILRTAPKRIEAYVRANVPVGEGAVNPSTGKVDYVVKGDKRKELNKAMAEIRDEIVEEIMAI